VTLVKKPLSIDAAIFLTAVSTHASGGKISYVDTQTIFNKTMLGKKYQGIEFEYCESCKKILDLDTDEIQKRHNDCNKQTLAKVNDPAQREKEDALKRKIDEFKKVRAEFSNEISTKKEELSNKFNERVLAVLKEIAKRENLSLILNRTVSISKVEAQSLTYVEEDLDITEKIIAEIDAKEAVVE